MCYYPRDPYLFCNSPSWNAVKFRVKEITKDLPSRQDIYESLTKNEVEKRESLTKHEVEKRELDFGSMSLPPLSPSSPQKGVWSKVEEIWMNSERQVVAVVEESWGLGDVKRGDEMILFSHNSDSMCGVAGMLEPGMVGYLWLEEGTEKMGVDGCELFRFQSEEDFEGMSCLIF